LRQYLDLERAEKKDVKLNNLLLSCAYAKANIAKEVVFDFKAGDITVFTDEWLYTKS